jgi:hypothetical protein
VDTADAARDTTVVPCDMGHTATTWPHSGRDRNSVCSQLPNGVTGRRTHLSHDSYIAFPCPTTVTSTANLPHAMGLWVDTMTYLR